MSEMPPPGPRKHVVPSLTNPNPANMNQEMRTDAWSLQSVIVKDAENRLLLDKAAMDLPPWLISLFNQVRMMRVELSTLEYALCKPPKPVLTQAELLVARQEVNALTEQAFRSLQAEMARRQSQPPVNPSDPRAAPQ